LQAEQILTGSRADLYEKVGAKKKKKKNPVFARATRE